LLDTADREPSAILTFSLPEQRLYEVKRDDEPVIWLDALESIIQGSSDLATCPVEVAFRNEATLSECAKEKDAVVGGSSCDINR
jgi:hypothetical protein